MQSATCEASRSAARLPLHPTFAFGFTSSLFISENRCCKLSMPEEGVEPSHPCGYGILSPERLPVPPLRLKYVLEMITFLNFFVNRFAGFKQNPRSPVNNPQRGVRRLNRKYLEDHELMIKPFYISRFILN